jgi:hypothetical protein
MERPNNNLLIVENALGLDIDVFQGLAYHVIIWHESRPHNYFV